VLHIQAAADAVEQHLDVLTASTQSDLEAAFATMLLCRISAVIVPDASFISRRERLVELAARHAMPAIYPFRVFADVAGLISYGSSVPDLNRPAGIYVGRILKGAKPVDLPSNRAAKLNW
jgi:putative tryptophan/tyrosine transport system substrate-binding protein